MTLHDVDVSDVSDDAIPYDSRRQYRTAVTGRHHGAEIGVDVQSNVGVLANAAVTASEHR